MSHYCKITITCFVAAYVGLFSQLVLQTVVAFLRCETLSSVLHWVKYWLVGWETCNFSSIFEWMWVKSTKSLVKFFRAVQNDFHKSHSERSLSVWRFFDVVCFCDRLVCWSSCSYYFAQFYDICLSHWFAFWWLWADFFQSWCDDRHN